MCIEIIWTNSFGRQTCPGWGLNPGYVIYSYVMYVVVDIMATADADIPAQNQQNAVSKTCFILCDMLVVL